MPRPRRESIRIKNKKRKLDLTHEVNILYDILYHFNLWAKDTVHYEIFNCKLDKTCIY